MTDYRHERSIRIFGDVFARVADTGNNFAHLAQWKQSDRPIFLGQLLKQVTPVRRRPSALATSPIRVIRSP
jgi:hypothetical protein